jgi:aminopeptidase N
MQYMKRIFLLALTCSAALFSQAQFTAADSLRGGYGDTRDWWDLLHYDLHVTFDIPKKEIRGFNTITFTPQERISDRRLLPRTLQIDLQSPMELDSIVLEDPMNVLQGNNVFKGRRLEHKGNAWLFKPHNEWLTSRSQITVYFHGKPREALNAPWDGGVIWTKDANGSPWVTVACQGLGASAWFPCKDSQADEPDNGVKMHYTCSSKLMCVSNGHFTGRKDIGNGLSTFSWEVENPINNYCMIPYIGDYVNLHEHYKGEKGMLEIDYWVIRGNEEKAQQQFKDAPRTLEALEYWFGPYPFYEDGYKLVEAPHLGMEHQSAVAYGNRYQNGYLGRDLSGTGEGMKWDFIIVHESGHEWFGNSITSKDIADMWIHESFTNYSETLFTDYWFGKTHGNVYSVGLRKNILNDKPVIGPYGVNTEGSSDMYYKGSNMLHTIRQVVDNDSVFRMLLREMNVTFYHKTVTTQEIEQFMSDYLKMDLKTVFDQYLRTNTPPTLELNYKKGKVIYRWSNTVDDFQMQVKMNNGKWITPSRKWKKLRFPKKEAIPQPDPNFYILVNRTFNGVPEDF